MHWDLFVNIHACNHEKNLVVVQDPPLSRLLLVLLIGLGGNLGTYYGSQKINDKF